MGPWICSWTSSLFVLSILIFGRHTSCNHRIYYCVLERNRFWLRYSLTRFYFVYFEKYEENTKIIIAIFIFSTQMIKFGKPLLPFKLNVYQLYRIVTTVEVFLIAFSFNQLNTWISVLHSFFKIQWCPEYTKSVKYICALCQLTHSAVLLGPKPVHAVLVL